MESIKHHFDESEKEQKKLYEQFPQKNLNNDYLNDLQILKFRLYTYKELLKLFTINMKSAAFESSRHAFYSCFILPIVVSTGFNLLNPFSMFRRMAITTSLCGSVISFYINLKEDL